MTTFQQNILDLIRSKGGTATGAEIVAEFGQHFQSPHTSIAHHLTKMAKSGVITTDGRGNYTTEKQEEKPDNGENQLNLFY